jgi:hypothetical protein
MAYDNDYDDDDEADEYDYLSTPGRRRSEAGPEAESGGSSGLGCGIVLGLVIVALLVVAGPFISKYEHGAASVHSLDERGLQMPMRRSLETMSFENQKLRARVRTAAHHRPARRDRTLSLCAASRAQINATEAENAELRERLRAQLRATPGLKGAVLESDLRRAAPAPRARAAEREPRARRAAALPTAPTLPATRPADLSGARRAGDEAAARKRKRSPVNFDQERATAVATRTSAGGPGQIILTFVNKVRRARLPTQRVNSSPNKHEFMSPRTPLR